MKIVVDENIPFAQFYFSGFGAVVPRPGREISSADVADADILIVRSVTKVNDALLSNSNVRFVGSCTIGTDHIDLNYLQERGIQFAHAPGCNADAVVDYVLACIYKLKSFSKPEDVSVGVIGNGNVGSRLALRLRNIGFHVKVNDPPQKMSGVGGLSSLTDTLACDIVSLHVPFTMSGEFSTHHLLGEKELAGLPEDALLINAARGGVIDESALLKLLDQKPTLRVALDVWEGEPLLAERVARRVNLATPHIAGYSVEGKVRGTFMIYQALSRFLKMPEQYALQLPALKKVHSVKEIRELVLSLYDPERDTQDLLDTLNLPTTERAKAFDQLRKNYPERFEFARYLIDSVTISHSKLESHGFLAASRC